MTVQPTVSIVVLNWNGKQYLQNCLSSLLRQNYPNIEIIFVDNGSTDGSVAFVREKYPYAIIIMHKKNLGFAQGVNSGITASHGKYIATINNDAEADSGWISNLMHVMGSDPRIGSCASKMLRYYDRNIIDSAGIIVYQNGNAYDRGAQEVDRGQYDVQTEIFGACAGAALYSRKMFEEIGPFDDKYFAYFEDVDLSFRMHLFGWKCIFVPDAIVYHIHSATSQQASPFKIFYIERNKLWNMWKYFPLSVLITQFPFTNIHYFKYIIKFFNKLIMRKDNKENIDPIFNYSFLSIISAVIRAKLSAYGKLHNMVKQRKKLRSKGADMSALEPWIIKDYKRE
ncbi:MAG: glycosyltransferase family 2 protein [Candidatus Methanoperedens sp.]|nr:glycosyltransferase family 2 protein [Candidatus Methanoperedens sp.]